MPSESVGERTSATRGSRIFRPVGCLNLPGMDIDNIYNMTIIIVMMSPADRYEIIYPPIIKGHLKTIDVKVYSLIRESLEILLRYEPDVETRNRKPLKRPAISGAKWEIRFGPDNCFRVFYRVDHDHREVMILAIGEKIGSRLFIGGEEI